MFWNCQGKMLTLNQVFSFENCNNWKFSSLFEVGYWYAENREIISLSASHNGLYHFSRD